MVVYLDVLFVFNFLINFLLLYIIEVAYMEKVKLKKIVFGSLVGGAMIVAFLLNSFIFNLTKITGGIVVASLGLKSSSIFKTIIKISSFYILNFASVGFVSSFHIIDWYFLLIVLALITVIFFIESNKKTHIFVNNLKYNVSVTFNHKRLDLEGFLDTGNFSKDDDYPIVYLSNKYLKNKLLVKAIIECRYKIVNVNTVNGISQNVSYKPDCFIIRINKERVKKDVLVVFSNLHDFDCLLNSELFI